MFERIHVIAKRKKLIKGLWSRDEVELLKKLYPNRNPQEVAEKIGRSLYAVREKAFRLGLKKNGYSGWLKDDVELLRKLFPNRSTRYVADKLGRSLSSTADKAYQMGIKKTKRYLKSIGRA